MFKANIHVTLKKSILDPQGTAVQKALHSLNYVNVTDVRLGKYFEVQLDAPDRAAAEAQVREMCERLLANPVIEDFTFELVEV
ncbi:MAG: phosphoribosylformylglycinamidine synthase subunit PurS [Firmicutes bacterium]|nr:phosphoribosylformylglycinamidine synthase subunit PurS [Bacillota bacterium]